MIVILDGPLGVGKTEVAWKLVEKFERAIMLDGGYLGAVYPFEIHGEQRMVYPYDTICHAASPIGRGVDEGRVARGIEHPAK
jgi:cytidylate kinase